MRVCVLQKQAPHDSVRLPSLGLELRIGLCATACLPPSNPFLVLACAR